MLLQLTGVNKRFGAVVAADDVTMHVEKGEALGIIGANGAGKSSLFNLCTGVLKADSGEIKFHGHDVTRASVRERCREGMGRSFQIPKPFESLTVFENLLTAAEFGCKDDRRSIGETARILEITGLADKANTEAGKLTLLNRKRLELARALATTPDLLLLDEIAGGLTEGECHELVELIKDLNAQGVTIVWIEHIVHALLSVVSRLIVLERGKIIAQGEPKAVMNDPEVKRSYLGIDDDMDEEVA
ncbi:ABC transporter ATP-binding protein [Pseudoroseicyclus tamaricis]|uniref:ABC transporter ATP-binding protein n=1 Tax=Pseudoroseicyclus tamaricis TaxID=2705421 RepID=A0A6B2K2L3_9RHOB|nr:ABC transporter ATP-binding protein [Pseudoroseicyclus tamaricis]NDV02824.1 ABC transporter ATP-binding protein [Pseudoroseicyclus tamaricis]